LGASGNGKRKRANNTFFSAVGRDKVLRTVQYFSRFYAWYLFRTNNPQSAIDPFDQTKKQLGLTRKILRVGKFIEHFKAAATAADAKVIDHVLRYLSVARQLGYAGYLALDSLTVVRYTFCSAVRAQRN
jgi:peroxin-11B